jgi:hypothetical protein
VVAHVRLIREPKPVAGGHPAALPDVVAKGGMTHRSLGVAAEVCVDVVVEIHRVGHLTPR